MKPAELEEIASVVFRVAPDLGERWCAGSRGSTSEGSLPLAQAQEIHESLYLGDVLRRRRLKLLD
jgi:hypothetical protein